MLMNRGGNWVSLEDVKDELIDNFDSAIGTYQQLGSSRWGVWVEIGNYSWTPVSYEHAAYVYSEAKAKKKAAKHLSLFKKRYAWLLDRKNGVVK